MLWVLFHMQNIKHDSGPKLVILYPSDPKIKLNFPIKNCTMF